MSDEKVRRTVSDCCASELEDRPFRAAVLDAIKSVVPFDAYVWVLTDPVSSVGVSPLAYIPDLDMQRLRLIIGAKYMTPVNRWTTLPVDGCARLSDGDPARSTLWRTAVGEVPVADIMSAVMRDRFGCWGFLDLYRYGQPFGEQHESFVRSLLAELTGALRRRVADLFTPAVDGSARLDPAIILFDDKLAAVSETSAAERSFRLLLPTDPRSSPIPAAAMNVSAQLLAREAGVDTSPPRARFHSHDGLWVTLQADRLQHMNTSMVASIAVAVDPIGPADRVEVFCRSFGLTPRETQALVKLAGGASTRIAARALGLSEYTLQDHLKAIFAKTSTASRAELIALATGSGPV
jgi:DNA-binding CsgD family transcriptional regulator